MFGFETYCKSNSGGSGSGGSSPPVWCSNSVPSLYGYVQKAYWDVGFLRFYRYLNRVSFSSKTYVKVSRGKNKLFS